MQTRIKYRLGWVEAGLYIGGAALLAVFFLLRFEGERQREAGIAAFTRAVEKQVTITGPALGDSMTASVGTPDQSLWSESRIDQYQESLAVGAGPPLAVMTVARLGIQVPVYDGTDDFNLNRGVGRIEGTAAVDDVGNLGIAGHRDSFFRGLKDIQIGDEIELLTTRGHLAYTVSSIEIVDPTDVWVLEPTENKTMTLVTCYPFYYVGQAPRRYIVKATAEHFLAKTE
jgi:sortase A